MHRSLNTRPVSVAAQARACAGTQNTKIQAQLPSKAGLAQLGERQTEVHFTHKSEGRVFDPHKPQSTFPFADFMICVVEFFMLLPEGAQQG